ncbi:hypothetical protein MferCBS31731_001115 [Microsporum ferrugineum]
MWFPALVALFAFSFAALLSPVMSDTPMAALDSSTTTGPVTAGENGWVVAARVMAFVAPVIGFITAVLLSPYGEPVVLWYRNQGKTGDAVIKSQAEKIETIRDDVSSLKRTLGLFEAVIFGDPNDGSLKAALTSVRDRLRSVEESYQSLETAQGTTQRTLEGSLRTPRAFEADHETLMNTLREVIRKVDTLNTSLEELKAGSGRIEVALDRLQASPVVRVRLTGRRAAGLLRRRFRR